MKVAGRDIHGGYFPATDLDGAINAARELRGANGFPEFWAVAGKKSNTIPVIAEIINHATGEVASSEAIAQVGTTQVAP